MNIYWISLPCDLLSSLASFQCSLLHHLHLSSNLGLSKYVNQHSHLNLCRNVHLSVLYDLDFNKAWGRLERRWNQKTREDKVEVYTKFLNYKLENTRQKPMDWLAFMEKKCTELINTGPRMDDEMFIMHLLNSLPQSEYEGAILIIKDKLRNGYVELLEIEQILEDKVQAMKNAKGWYEHEYHPNPAYFPLCCFAHFLEQY